MADGGGFDPSLLLFGPQYLQIQRQQALAQRLMGAQPVPYEIGGYPTGPQAFLASGLSNVLGAYEARQADKGLTNLYGQSGLLGGPRSFQPTNSGQVGNQPQQQAQDQSQQPQTPLWVQAKIVEMQYGPDVAKAFVSTNGDLERAKQLVNAGLMKGTALEPPTAPQGWVQQPDPTAPGGYRLVQETGGQQAVTGSAASKAHGEEKPIQITTSGGVPQYVYPSDLAGPPPGIRTDQNGAARPTSNLGVDYNNALNIQPSGQEARFQNPTAGVLAADRLLQNYGSRGINTVSGIVSTWAPQAPPQYAAQIAQKMGVSPDQPLNLNDVNVRGAYLEAASPHETGRPLPTAGGAATPPQLQTPVGAALQKSAGENAADFASLKSNTENLLQIIKDARTLNQRLPNSGLIPMEARAEGSRRMASMPFGDKGQLAANYDSWESLMNIKAINAIEQIAKSGIGRMDIPIVNAVKAAILASADNTQTGRGQVLDQLESMVRNNLSTAQNTLANLNQPGAQMSHAPLVSSFPNQQQQAPQSQQFDESGKTVYRDKHGNMARRQNGQWVEVAH